VPLAVLADGAPLLWMAELVVAPLAEKLSQLFSNASPAGEWGVTRGHVTLQQGLGWVGVGVG